VASREVLAREAAVVRGGHLADVDCFLTDADPPAGIADRLAAAGVELIVAAPASPAAGRLAQEAAAP